MIESTQRIARQFDAGEGGGAIRALAQIIGDDRNHVLVPRLAEWVDASLASADSQRRCYADLWRERGFDRRSVQALAEILARAGFHASAIAFLRLAFTPDDPGTAYQRAQWAMLTGDYAQVIAAADQLIATMVRPRISVARFIERALAGESARELLVFERADVARLPRLRKPLVLRWEALRRCRRYAEADQVRELCIRYWPERVSVWEAAGNHALEAADPEAADHYFGRALALDPRSTTALAGRAVVHEMRKSWETALELRRTVADNTGAWSRQDAASLHRVIRYAANLGRLGRWTEAGPHLRRAVRCGAFQQLAPERPVLWRAFTSELYAPAFVVRLAAAATELGEAIPGEAVFALEDARQLGELAQSLDPTAQYASLGMSALLAGDPEAAYEWFERADSVSAGDLGVAYLRLSSAKEAGATDTSELEQRTIELSRSLRPTAEPGSSTAFYAELVALRFDPSAPRVRANYEQLVRILHARQDAMDDVNALAAELPTLDRTEPVELLAFWTAIREAAVAAGYPVGIAARLSARARRAALALE